MADLYLAGSDQIWNSYMNNGKDDAFYLDFGSPMVIRCSYAASFGASTVNEDFKDYIRDKIAKLDFVSVREESGLSILLDMGFSEVSQVLDPVFLLTKDDWKEVAARSSLSINRPYILIYAIAGLSSEFKKFALHLKEKYNYAIVSILGVRVSFADYNISSSGPCEFVSLIASASYVLSDSFHASAFSVLFNCPFFIFPKSSLNHSARMVDFCKMLDVSWAYAPDIDVVCEKKHNWDQINDFIRVKREQSIDYLQKCISLCGKR